MSERTKPYGGASNNRLTKLINTANGTSLVEGVDFEYGVPIIEETNTSNTKVVVHSKSDDARSQVVRYKRLDIGALALLPESEVAAVYIENWPISIHDRLNEINESLGVNLTPEEVVNSIHRDTGQTKIPLNISNKSLAWIESEYMFDIRRAAISFIDIFVNTVLDGINPPLKK